MPSTVTKITHQSPADGDSLALPSSGILVVSGIAWAGTRGSSRETATVWAQLQKDADSAEKLPPPLLSSYPLTFREGKTEADNAARWTFVLTGLQAKGSYRLTVFAFTAPHGIGSGTIAFTLT